MKRVLIGAALAATAPLIMTSPAQADTENCASMAEYDQLHSLMSPGSVSALFDIDGWYIGENDNVFKRGYKPCWNPDDKKIVVAYDIDTALSVWWDVRDR